MQSCLRKEWLCPEGYGQLALWREAGISEASVRRIWRAHGLKPHRVESFKISRDPEFAAKLEDVVGLFWPRPFFTGRPGCVRSSACI